MKVPGIEEICRTFGDTAYIAHKWDGIPELSQSMYRAGLLAVFETHVKGMLAEAMHEGIVQRDRARPPSYETENPTAYADRKISQLKKPRHD